MSFFRAISKITVCVCYREEVSVWMSLERYSRGNEKAVSKHDEVSSIRWREQRKAITQAKNDLWEVASPLAEEYRTLSRIPSGFQTKDRISRST